MIVSEVLKMATTVEVMWVTCFMQESVNRKGFVCELLIILILLYFIDFLDLATP